MIALVDCNSFFCSVEKAFHPGLNGKPVCVLSSNDGCIVALTPEAKALGLHRGDPIFKVKSIVEANNVTLFSTNMQLYAAMSKRIVRILRQSVERVESYSIDECFCYLDGYEKYFKIEQYMREVAEKIELYTGVPVSVGIAPSKTLAKMGSKFAKNYKGYKSVCVIDTDEKRKKALALFDLADVWGVGRQTLQKLNYYGVTTPLEFAEKSESWVKSRFNKPTYQTWLELNGVSCIDTTEIIRNQSICTSRSFGDMVKDLDSLKASVATFASSCANKLRAQNAVAKTITVFLRSNRFRTDLEQYANMESMTLLTPTSDTIELTDAAMKILQRIFKPGISYKKSGVILSDIATNSVVQHDLFDDIKNRSERQNLMKAIDSINQKYGPKTVKLTVEGEKEQAWKVKCVHKSPNYLTDINEILTIHI